METIATIVRECALLAHLVTLGWASVTVVHEGRALLRARRVEVLRLRTSAGLVSMQLGLLWLTGLTMLLLDSGADLLAWLTEPARAAKLALVLLLTLAQVLIHHVALPLLTTPQARPERAAMGCTLIGVVAAGTWIGAALVGVAPLVMPPLDLGDYLMLHALALVATLLVGLVWVGPRLRRLISVTGKLRAARLPFRASLADVDFNATPVPKVKLVQLANGGFIERRENVLIVGSACSGKTFLATVIGTELITRFGHQVRCYPAKDLALALEREVADDRGGHVASVLRNLSLLIIDDLGREPLSPVAAQALSDLLGELHNRTSVIVATHLDPGEWLRIFGGRQLTLALLDRFSDSFHVLRTGDIPVEARRDLAAAAAAAASSRRASDGGHRGGQGGGQGGGNGNGGGGGDPNRLSRRRLRSDGGDAVPTRKL